jgi:hypothetical protein
MLNVTYAKYYSPSEYLADDEVIVLLKGRIVFKHYIAKKHECSVINVYILCDMAGYTYNMSVCWGKDRQNAIQ